MLPQTILVPTDFSDGAAQALDYAIELAGKLGANVHVVNALGVPATGLADLDVALSAVTGEEALAKSQAALDALAAARPGLSTMLRSGDAPDVIIQAAQEIGAGMIVMGTHGRRGLKRALMGSVAESVVRSAPCPVLTVRFAE